MGRWPISPEQGITNRESHGYRDRNLFVLLYIISTNKDKQDFYELPWTYLHGHSSPSRFFNHLLFLFLFLFFFLLLFFNLKKSFNLLLLFLMIVIYHHTQILIDFQYRRRLNLKSLIQSSEILPIDRTELGLGVKGGSPASNSAAQQLMNFFLCLCCVRVRLRKKLFCLKLFKGSSRLIGLNLFRFTIGNFRCWANFFEFVYFVLDLNLLIFLQPLKGGEC